MKPMLGLTHAPRLISQALKLVRVDFTGSDLSAATFSSETQFSDGYIGVTSMKPMLGLVLLMAPRLISGLNLSVDFTGSDLSAATFSSETSVLGWCNRGESQHQCQH